MARCSSTSLVLMRSPARMLPSRSERQRWAGVISRLLIIVGVQSRYFSPSRTLILPPLPSTYCRSHSLRPTRMISSRKASASKRSAASSGELASGCAACELSATACAASLHCSSSATQLCSMDDLTRVLQDLPTASAGPFLRLYIEGTRLEVRGGYPSISQSTKKDGAPGER